MEKDSSVLQPSSNLVSSPCMGVCAIDVQTGTCIGCLRTVDEIGAWRTMSLQEKREVVMSCKLRACHLQNVTS
ncbi:MAG: DUF1289 domain-containing protein [Rhodospirillaceae bacterium]